MRVTNAMIMNNALNDLGQLRAKYEKAQAQVNGRGLERPSEDPAKVVEVVDLSAAKVRLERSQRSSGDAKDWLNAAEDQLAAMVEQMNQVRDLAMQSGSPAVQQPAERERMASAVETLRDSLLSQMNAQYRGQYLFAGGKMKTKPFELDPMTGGAVYLGSNTEITREIAPGMSIATNLPGSQLKAANGDDFIATLTKLADDMRNGRFADISTKRLAEIDTESNHLIDLRSAIGVRQEQVERYAAFSQDALLHIEERVSQLAGGSMEQMVLRLADAQAAYQAALTAVSKTMPMSLLDFMR